MTFLYKRHAAYVRHCVMTLNMTLLQSFAAHLHGDDAYDDAHTISCVAMRESYGPIMKVQLQKMAEISLTNY